MCNYGQETGPFEQYASLNGSFLTGRLPRLQCCAEGCAPHLLPSILRVDSVRCLWPGQQTFSFNATQGTALLALGQWPSHQHKLLVNSHQSDTNRNSYKSCVKRLGCGSPDRLSKTGATFKPRLQHFSLKRCQSSKFNNLSHLRMRQSSVLLCHRFALAQC